MKKTADLMVMMYVDSVEEARAFYIDKLGFSHMMGMLGKDGLLDYVTLSLNGARLMLMRPAEEIAGSSAGAARRPVEFYNEVADVDGCCEQLKNHKIKPATPLTDRCGATVRSS